MVTRTLTVELPETLYNHFVAQAQAKQQNVDEIVLDTLSLHGPPTVEDDLPPKLQIELSAMANLSDEALRVIAQSTMNDDKIALYDLLLERNQSGDLTGEGRQLLESLHEEADFLMLRKAHAYALLQSRGHKLPSIQELRHSQL